jgi:ATP-dependent RNA helicase DHX29
MIFPHFIAAKKNSKHGSLKEHMTHSPHPVSSNSETANIEGGQNDLGVAENKSDSFSNIDEGPDLKKGIPNDAVEIRTKEIEEEEIELGSMFFEDSSAWDAVAPEILKQQKIEKLSHDGYGHLFLRIDRTCFMLDFASAMHLFLTVHFFQLQGDSGKMPKAVLQKFCQRLGWEAPKYSKISEKDGKFVYAVNVLRGATGRGKSRKAGGLTKIQLSEIDEEYGSVEVITLLFFIFLSKLANYYSDTYASGSQLVMLVSESTYLLINNSRGITDTYI